MPATLDDRDRAIVDALAPHLRASGFFFVGLDVIGGWLTEINVTSPTGILEANTLYGAHFETRVLEKIEEKVKALQPRFRTSLRSRERRLREKGKVELRFLDTLKLWEEGLEAIKSIEEDSWKVGAGTAITVQDFQWEFYRRYAPIAAAAGTLRIPVLHLDDEPVAYDYALLHHGVYYLMKTSYKNKWHDSYPGFVLRYLLMDWTYSQNVGEIDFLGKDEDEMD